MNPIEVADRLAELCKGLLFPSESDYPLEPFIWENTPINSETILIKSGKSADTSIEAVTLDDFFAPTVNAQESDLATDQAIAQRFWELKRAIAGLENIQVFKIGKIKIDVYIVGAIGNDVIGLKTTVIET
jgi:Nuclease A inhibitor-like protein